MNVVHRDTTTVIFARDVTLTDAIHCYTFKHVTFKGVVSDKILVYNKFEVLTYFICTDEMCFQHVERYNQLEPKGCRHHPQCF